MSTHLLSLIPPDRLGVRSGADSVGVFAVVGGHYVGTTLHIHLPTLSAEIAQLPRGIETVAFIEDPQPDPGDLAVIDEMIVALGESSADALAASTSFTEAVKRVEGNRIVESVDRDHLFTTRPPEVVRRTALQRAVGGLISSGWVNVTELIAADGGAVVLHGIATVETPPRS